MVTGNFTIPLCLALFPLNACGVLYDFNNGNDSGWTHFDLSAAGQPGSTYSFPPDGSGGYAYRIFSPAPTVTSVGPARTLSYLTNATYTNFTVTVDLLGWDTNLYQAFGVAVRVANVGLGQTVGYVFNYNPIQTPGAPGGEFQLNCITAEQPRMPAAAALSLDPSRKYRMVVTGFGSYLAGRIYDLSDLSTPLASLDVVDSTYSSGFVGLFNYSLAAGLDQTNATSNADSTFDNFSVIDSAPTNQPPPYCVYAGAPQVIDSTSMVTNLIDDFTDHTYATNAGPIGSFADCSITRLFAFPIQSIKLTIVAGMADDLGYVGSLLVASNFDQTDSVHWGGKRYELGGRDQPSPDQRECGDILAASKRELLLHNRLGNRDAGFQNKCAVPLASPACATAATDPHSIRTLRDSDLADRLRRVQLRWVCSAIYHEPWFIGGLEHQFFATGRHRRAEHNYQRYVRRTAVLPVKPVIKTMPKQSERRHPWICPKRGWRLGGVGTFGVIACVQEVAVTPGELLADADLIHYAEPVSHYRRSPTPARGPFPLSGCTLSLCAYTPAPCMIFITSATSFAAKASPSRRSRGGSARRFTSIRSTR